MNSTLKFYKESTGSWYVDLPDWTGSKDDLQMVLGADTLLDLLCEGEDQVEIYFSTEIYENANVLGKIGEGFQGDESYGGATYRMSRYSGIYYGLDLWLCDVTIYVFGEFPKFIYFTKEV